MEGIEECKEKSSFCVYCVKREKREMREKA